MQARGGIVPLLMEAGGIIIFAVLASMGCTRLAIAATVAFVAFDAMRRVRGHLGMPRLWVLSNGLALVLGVVDLSCATPFLFRYESVFTNIVLAAAFALGAFGRKSIVQTIVEERQGMPISSDRVGLLAFFRAFTLLWSGYFMLKAMAYLWMAVYLTPERALAIRGTLGTGSLVAMILLGQRGADVFRLCRRMGVFRQGT
ncbi:hypothetical protein [Novacetimonas pomaceti]|uniref:hypothetical protein n=1 Tax=Novacetimonas pomaceti TaxID=2021998 RepID=UPI001C2DB34C|nr:hypothetical protein [Novacetimonas pomaceti]MBV1833457.1 hypothetical protein [Novacetimonas pomaceti]